jgi:hypothetical protein
MYPGQISSFYYALNRHVEWDNPAKEYNYLSEANVFDSNYLVALKSAFIHSAMRLVRWIDANDYRYSQGLTKQAQVCDCSPLT